MKVKTNQSAKQLTDHTVNQPNQSTNQSVRSVNHAAIHRQQRTKQGKRRGITLASKTLKHRQNPVCSSTSQCDRLWNQRNKESGAESLLRAKHSNTDTSFRLFYNQIDDGTNKTRKATRIHFCKQTTQTPAHLACSATRSTMERTKQGKQRGFTLASKPLKAPTHLVCSKPHKSSAVSSTPQLSLTVKKHSQTPRSWNRTFLQANLIHLRHA
jgi:hypothetical protein